MGVRIPPFRTTTRQGPIYWAFFHFSRTIANGSLTDGSRRGKTGRDEAGAGEIVHGRASAAVSDACHLHPELLHQDQRAQMRGGADACMAVGDLGFLGANPVEKLWQRKRCMLRLG